MTHADAKKVAEEITLAQLQELLAAQPMPTILVKNRSRKHSTDTVSVFPEFRTPFIGFTHCNRKGYETISTANLADTIFDFYNLGRIVQVAL